MSQENVKVGLDLVDAVNRRDIDAFVACLSPDVEWEENGDVPGARVTYRGRAEEIFSELVITATRRGSGVETELRFWTASWLADGKVAKRQVFWSRDEALAAVGLED